MMLLRCRVKNFGSYDLFEFDFSNQGLALVHGPTGAGKSTLMDMAAWILYGITAKDGAVDDIRSWTNSEEPTYAALEIQLPNAHIRVIRIRGKQNQNDLYWEEYEGSVVHRGKDINETQKLLEKRLGITADLFLAGAYYHEFSPTASFFVTNAKQRRAILEKIAVLDLPVRLGTASTAERKKVKEELKAAELRLAKEQAKLEQLIQNQERAKEYAEGWQRKQMSLVEELEVKYNNFEVEKSSKIAALQLKSDLFEKSRYTKTDSIISSLENIQKQLDACPSMEGPECITCGAPNKQVLQAKERRNELSYAYKTLLKDLERHQNEENSFIKEIATADRLENHYGTQLASEIKKVNPFAVQVSSASIAIAQTDADVKLASADCKNLTTRVSDLSHLYDLALSLRGALLQRAVSEVETQTNSYLETYFEGEFRVSFSLSGDDLDVSITKGGYPCVYQQLSKGQRGMLKLAFVISIMKASANNAGVHFDNLFFDEALDGLDADLKVKAYSLFESLSTEHSSILVIDHATELQNLFTKKFKVSMVGDTSRIEADGE